MLRRLTINNYALIEALDIEFPEGLIIITGETGAGKSILLGALSLLLGGKAEISAIKDNKENCMVEGLFVAKKPVKIVWQDGTSTYEEELVLRRILTPSGRSRSFINDEPVTNMILSEISSELIDIHAQNQHLLLNDSLFRMNILDLYADSAKELLEYKKSLFSLKKLQEKRVEVEKKIARATQEAEYKQYQLEKISEINLKEGETGELENEQKQLANADAIKSSLMHAAELLRPMGESVVQSMKEASQILLKYSSFVPKLQELSQRLESCRIECKDIEEEIALIEEKTTVSPKRLEEVENRLSLIYDTLRRYECRDETELTAYKQRLQEELEVSENDLQEYAKLKREESSMEICRNEAAVKLSAKRKAVYSKLGETVQEAIRELEMPHAIFKIQLESSKDFGENGTDNINFLFSANGNDRTNELSKVASGGELSRIMLCLKAIMAKYTGMPTMIFDEIDTGVSGRIADKMGQIIDELGENMQVFAITHLPQIASKGETHLLVYKVFENKSAKTYIKSISDEERTMEIARMLSGEQLSAAAVENAKYLLKK